MALQPDLEVTMRKCCARQQAHVWPRAEICCFCRSFSLFILVDLAHPQIPSSSLALDDGDNELAVPGAGILPA